MCLFDDFELSIQTGEFAAVVGSNGSGKTSMLNIICGNIEADQGRIYLGEVDITRQKAYLRQRRIGRVYQDPSKGTCQSMTILENMALADHKGKSYGLRRGISKGRIAYYREQLAQLELGLEEKLDTRVGALSGGQRQALALLMAVMTPIDVLILDEHTAALDPKTADHIMDLTERLVHEKGLTTIMVTHNLRYATEYGSRLLMLHEGKLVMDRSGEAKKRTTTEEIMEIFNRISVECGN